MVSRHRYEEALLDEEVSPKGKNRLKYIKMVFRPCGTLLVCLSIALIIAALCILMLCLSRQGGIVYDVALAMLTGVIASVIVSVSIECCNNYRRNRQRLIILHEYLYVASMYEETVQLSLDNVKGRYGTDEHPEAQSYSSPELTLRQIAVAAIELEVVPPVDAALEKGREYLRRKEMELMIQVVEASNEIAAITDGVIDKNLKSKCYPEYEILSDEFKSKIVQFSNEAGIELFSENLRSVVFDYVMSNLEILEDADRNLLKYNLQKIDDCMKELQKFIKDEPVYYENLIPFDERMEKARKKFDKKRRR